MSGDTRLLTGHGHTSLACTRARALLNLSLRRRWAEIRGLLEACVGRAGDRLAGTRLVAGHPRRTPGHGTGHTLATGRAGLSDLAVLRCRHGLAEGVVLLTTDVVVTGHVATAAWLVPGHLFAPADHRAGDHATAQRAAGTDLLRRVADVARPRVLGTGRRAIGAGLIAGHLGRAADVASGHCPALEGVDLGNLGRGRLRAHATERLGLVRADVIVTGDALAGARLVARHLFTPTNLVPGHGVVTPGRAGPNPHRRLGRLGLAEVAKHVGRSNGSVRANPPFP